MTGDAIFFWPDMDPVTCYRNYRMLQRLAAGQPGRPGQPGQPGQPAQPVDKASIWDDVGLRCYVQYDKKSRRSGPMVCWDENGGKRFYCEYDEGEPEGVCCLFDQDQLQAVLECQEGKVNTVTLVANWAVTRKMLSRAEAMADTEGKAMIDKFNETEQQLKKESKAFHEAHEKSTQAGVAAVTVGKRGNMLANEAQARGGTGGVDEADREHRQGGPGEPKLLLEPGEQLLAAERRLALWPPGITRSPEKGTPLISTGFR